MNLKDETIFLMKKYGISANKRLGQNFLIDDNVVEEIIDNADNDQLELIEACDGDLTMLLDNLFQL